MSLQLRKLWHGTSMSIHEFVHVSIYVCSLIYSWYRVSDSAALYPIPSSQRVILSRTLLLIKNADERDAGKWVSNRQTANRWQSEYVKCSTVELFQTTQRLSLFGNAFPIKKIIENLQNIV